MRIFVASTLPDPTSRLTSLYHEGQHMTFYLDGDDDYIKAMDMRSTETFTVKIKNSSWTFKSYLHLTTTGWLKFGDLRTATEGIVAPGLLKIG